MSRSQVAAGALVLLAGFVLPGPAPAQIWVFTGPNGVVHFSDTPLHAGFKPHGPTSGARVRPRLESRVWDGYIARVGEAHAVSPGLVKAVIHTESGFDPRAVSRAGAKGLMQLMPATARRLGVDDPFDPWQNIEGGTRHLRVLMLRYDGDLPLTLAAYNAGGRAIRKFGGIPPYPETRRYVKKVLELARQYDADFR